MIEPWLTFTHEEKNNFASESTHSESPGIFGLIILDTRYLHYQTNGLIYMTIPLALFGCNNGRIHETIDFTTIM